jgi:predicted esterase
MGGSIAPRKLAVTAARIATPRRYSAHMRRAFVLALLSLAAVAGAAEPERGKLVEHVAARSDATQTYTLYLPSTYDPKHEYPLLFVFDPRQHGTKAAEIFKDAAEEFGWILISSNDTRSDGDSAPNEKAVRALIPEVSRYAVNPDRVYATGFSGTAILAWGVGLMTGKLAGVIGVGGRYVDGVPPAQFTFAHYGFTGSRDFNNREMRMVEAELDRTNKVPHRLHVFDGTHEWISPQLAHDALGWMEVLAKNERVTPKIFAEDVAAADAMQGLEALRRYRAILRTYDGRANVDAIRTKVAQLETDPAVQRAIKDEAKWDEFEKDYVNQVFARIGNLFATLRAQETPANAYDAARVFRVKDLRRHAGASGAEAATGRRLLEAVYTQASFYLMRQLFERQEYALAAALLGMAADIHPDLWYTWYNLGAAQARAGNRKAALEALEKAVGAGFTNAEMLAKDEDFTSVRGEKKYQEIAARLAPPSH